MLCCAGRAIPPQARRRGMGRSAAPRAETVRAMPVEQSLGLSQQAELGFRYETLDGDGAEIERLEPCRIGKSDRLDKGANDRPAGQISEKSLLDGGLRGRLAERRAHARERGRPRGLRRENQVLAGEHDGQRIRLSPKAVQSLRVAFHLRSLERVHAKGGACL